ncbi:hypothetical protein Tco_1573382, partial [Tanacetum coccineum]
VVNKEEFLPTVEEVWNKEVTGHNMYKVASQEDMVKNPHDKDAKVKEAECLADYFAALEDEEKFMFQKAKVDWISSGDRNIKFLGTNDKGIAMTTKNLFTNRLTVEGATKVVTDVTDKEIKEAMFDIGENKAPGPNGFC